MESKRDSGDTAYYLPLSNTKRKDNYRHSGRIPASNETAS